MHNAHAQAALHHGQQRKVAGHLIDGFGRGPEVVQKAGDFIVLHLLEVYKTLLRQAADGKAGLVHHGMLRGKHSHQRILKEVGGLKFPGRGHGQKAAVDHAPAQPFGDVAVFPREELNLNIWIFLMKQAQN
ncbi:hypothetical protein SDC9_202272 [bioreactor metagenome]|uniref:Uncharacterized protein n=1 Tax=bioreactor metagenome TaxID=1076179 RepID=A0A645IT68_9ZZZZ